MKTNEKDKLIKKLERKIKALECDVEYQRGRADSNYKEWMKRIGKTIVSWSKHEACQSVASNILGGFKAGDKVMILGRVIEVTSNYCYDNKGSNSSIKYIVEETRKLEE